VGTHARRRQVHDRRARRGRPRRHCDWTRTDGRSRASGSKRAGAPHARSTTARSRSRGWRRAASGSAPYRPPNRARRSRSSAERTCPREPRTSGWRPCPARR
jgi:hypothetical protein